MAKRVFLIVLDSFGIGELPDAKEYNDVGSDTLSAVRKSKKLNIKNLIKLGLYNIDGISGGISSPIASFAKLKEKSKGKDTTVGHWEIAGLISEDPLPVFPNGFPAEVIDEFEKRTNKKVICNKPYSGTEVIKDYGEEHLETGDLIVYTSADSVFQIACHEDKVAVSELYRYSQIAREILVGKYGVGRVIARPFTGEYPFTRTANRRDFSLKPTSKTMLDVISENGLDVISIGKIYDIFAGVGITEYVKTKDNADGIDKFFNYLDTDFNGLCFLNLVDFDSKYGHRNDVDGYASALTYFDEKLQLILSKLTSNDVLIITADHGCDPSTISTDHSREYVPMLIYGKEIKGGVNLKTRDSFADISATVLEILGIKDNNELKGESFYNLVKKV